MFVTKKNKSRCEQRIEDTKIEHVRNLESLGSVLTQDGKDEFQKLLAYDHIPLKHRPLYDHRIYIQILLYSFYSLLRA